MTKEFLGFKTIILNAIEEYYSTNIEIAEVNDRRLEAKELKQEKRAVLKAFKSLVKSNKPKTTND